MAKRASVRLPVEVTVDDGEAHDSWVTSLSTSGVFVVGDEASPGTRVSLSFSLPGTRFGLQGAVVRTQHGRGPDAAPGFGVAFTHSPPSWRAVAHFLMSQPSQTNQTNQLENPVVVPRRFDTRARVLIVTDIVRGVISRQEAAARCGVSLVQLFEWERKIRRANERSR